MADEWGGIVDLGLVGFPQAGNVCAVICTASYPLASGEIVHAATPINRCPWCGEAISIQSEIDNSPEMQATPTAIPELNF
jgi:hypothetical protein